MKVIAAITTYIYKYRVLCIDKNTWLQVHKAQPKTLHVSSLVYIAIVDPMY